MRFLFLSCNTGEGHNSCARALSEYFSSRGDFCEIRDAISFWSKNNSKIISKGHVFFYRNLPKLFGVAYRYEENHLPDDGDASLIYELLSNGSKKLAKYIKQEDFDAVICVHVFSAMMMKQVKYKRGVDVPTFFVATDYTGSPGIGESDCTKYFIPHIDLTDEFASLGIMRDRIIPSGIPISQNFYIRSEKTDVKKNLCLSPNERILLLTCGSMGCGPLKKLAMKLPTMLPKDVRLIVICGNNKRLYKSLSKNVIYDNVTIVGYTSRMQLYMDAAELILTKPGGLSSTEGATKHKPLVFINAVPGCETRNLDFFVSHGFGATGNDLTELCDTFIDLLDSREKLEKMSKRVAEDFDKNAAEIIYNDIEYTLQS